MNKKILITGGAGFIGSALIRHIISNTENSVINVDKLTYAGNLDSLESIKGSNRYFFELSDICESHKIEKIFKDYQPDIVMHLAAESHVDRSIDSPSEFINTNIFGTYVLLEESRKYWADLENDKKRNFRFHHISTDEVFGDLEKLEDLFTEDTPYAPSSPYSASKASSDHLVRAWHRTYKLPILITNCSNNFGPNQFPEKLIPLIIINALSEKLLPIYGNGMNIRDWLYVKDHANALLCVLENGITGRSYNIGSNNEKTNLEIVKMICNILDRLKPRSSGKYSSLISFVKDRPGHDIRYGIDSTRIRNELGWKPLFTFEEALENTVRWYLKNDYWWAPLIKNKNTMARQGIPRL